jgi:hypothetical protein
MGSKSKKALIALAFLAVALPGGPSAYAQNQSNGDDAHAEEPPTLPVAAAARREGDIHLDGRPDEPAWQDAVAITRFVQREPVENAPAEQPTEVRVLFDDGALYVSAVMHDSQADRIGDQLVRRDEHGQYDYFEFSVDPNSDRRTAYRFRVSAANVQRDVYIYDDVREDDAWNAVWSSSVHRDSTGWSTEIRIPLSQLKYNASDSTQTWGVNVSRRRLASNEVTFFALESRVQHGKVSVFGQLQGLQIPRSPRRIEFRPYALTSIYTAPADAGNPFFDGSDFQHRAGLDFRLGVGAGYTLDGTVNPDFGQVEVDPAVINLTQFETFFPERRPFFVEDAQIFNFTLSGGRSNQLFYSRRIGRAPQGAVPDEAQFEKVPSETTILGAAKFTGRSTGGLSLGAMGAVTSQEVGLAYVDSTGAIERHSVEPSSQFGVFRAQQDFRGGATTAGMIFTGMNRSLPTSGIFNFLTSNAFSLGVDFEHNWGGSGSRDWALWGYFAGTHIKGSQTALIDVQEASNHYFQRPDAVGLSVDSTATSLTGLNWRLQFERRSARHWTGALWLGQITPGFEANDMGFVPTGERLDAGARLTYREISPGSVFRNYSLTFFMFQNWRHEALKDPLSFNAWKHARKGGQFNLRNRFELLNYWELELNAEYRPDVLNDVWTRGGPLMVRPGAVEVQVGVETDRRKPISLEPNFQYEQLLDYGNRWSVGLGFQIRPAPNWELMLQPRYNTGLEPAQYVSTTDNVGFDPTYGSRYFFSDMRREQFSLETRLNVAVSPSLTLQLYAQPLISSGNYVTTKQLLASESFDFDVFEEGEAVDTGDGVTCVGGRTCVEDGERFVDWDGDGTTDWSFSDQNFHIQSLRVNAVLRWEYRPGSTVFLVWQQNRRARYDTSGFDLANGFNAIGAIPAENVFILKVNYWLGL